MENQPEILLQAQAYGEQALDLAFNWLISPAAWSQFALLVAAFVLALLVTRRLVPLLTKWQIRADDGQSLLSQLRRFACGFLPLLLPVLAYALTAIGEEIVRSLLDSGAVIAFGKRVFLFLVARILVGQIIQDGFLKLLGKYVLIPVTALYALGILDDVTAQLTAFQVSLGNISVLATALVRGLIAGSLLFWLGSWSNRQSADYVGRQEEMRPSTRELAMKTVEIIIFGVAFLMLMNIMGISLISLGVLGGAIGVGLGFGLQKIACNFFSGVILLIEGQATVGDYIELDGGEKGKIVKMTSRAAILETFDGRWVVVPNEDFITTRVINYSDSCSANRYEAPFSVSDDTNINKVPDIIEAVVTTHPEILKLPYPPDCELQGVGDSGVDFYVEFCANGLNDGDRKYTSNALFLIWNALKVRDIDIPYLHRVVEIKGVAGVSVFAQ
jgi:potassium efflux system protein